MAALFPGLSEVAVEVARRHRDAPIIEGDALVWDARTGGLLLRVRDLDKSDWHLPRLADDGASLHIHQRGGAVLTLPATRAGTFAAACRALSATDAKAEVQGACEG